MREIKFRAWDKMKKKMVKVNSVYFPNRNNKNMYVNNIQCNTPESFELIEYTGLKDKNGIEIYEGCIIMDEDFRKYAVVFADGMFGCMKSHLADYVTKRRYEVIDPLYNMTLNSVCIIGNIYENPELLVEIQND